MRLGMIGVTTAALAVGAICSLPTRVAAQSTAPGQPAIEDRKGDTMADSVIQRRIEDWAKAIRARDIDGVMAFYAPGIVSFDLNPPLRYAGTENKREAWQKFFAAYVGPVDYEVRDLSVMSDGELAFADSLNHVKGTAPGGHAVDLWVRWTGCFRRIDGIWRVVHDHVSVPADLKHGKAALNLTP